ncbi:heme exporter protein CcmD [Erythrobacter insulae]|uniref:Heme exporter protein D n=1 Tax=Erythrobacter insulae TaxID=2584124 RepID=A0A547P8J2_9SPHN|nr:heme exporter protein CcmD [Erythrobacter insulae]TRD10446.1 heme exporter protein CcmD [Erythrobacter insulae]
MREALDHWDFVIAAYAIGLGALAILIIWSWQSMRRAEKRKDEVKRR